MYEVHISNPAANGVVSEIAPAVRGSVVGFGVLGYSMVLQSISAFSLSDIDSRK